MEKLRKIKDADDAVVGIVVAFLVTGLIVIVIATIQMVYIPKWMEQSEADHMEMVADQFSQLKFSIDTQSAIRQPNTPISTSITLGNKEMPFLISSRSYGSLDILLNECNVTVVNASGSNSKSCPLGVIKYSSVNTYFLNQAYIYEAGALILSQSEGDTMSVKPAFSVKQQGNVTISFTLIDISAINGKKSITGYGTYPIQTEYPDDSPYSSDSMNDVEYINISTSYRNSWEKFINNTLINSGVSNTSFTINTDADGVSVKFLDPSNVSLNLKVIGICAQIAPGWIENTKGV